MARLLVTGGAGFIGSNLVRGLNNRGLNNILVVDDLSDGNKIKNIEDCDIHDYMDKAELYQEYINGSFMDSYNVTVGVEYSSKIVDVEEGTHVRLQIWDTVQT